MYAVLFVPFLLTHTKESFCSALAAGIAPMPARDTTEILIEVANTTTDLAIILKLTLLRLNILVSPFYIYHF
jgi:hypothetical protein